MIKKIAHITDLHLDEEFPFKDNISARKRFEKILTSIKDEGINHVVCTGDIGENRGIQYFFDNVRKMELSIALGNHDSFIRISEHYNKGADYNSKKIYRSELSDHFKLIYLDSSSNIIDYKQLQWLKKELITSNPIIIFIHHPIIGLNLKVDEIGSLKNRKEITKILLQVPNKITVYCGHYHMESTITYKNISQFITPAVAFQIDKNTSKIKINTTISGYRIIRQEKDKLSSEVKLLHNAN